jgi:hypothetical protein
MPEIPADSLMLTVPGIARDPRGLCLDSVVSIAGRQDTSNFDRKCSRMPRFPVALPDILCGWISPVTKPFSGLSKLATTG